MKLKLSISFILISIFLLFFGCKSGLDQNTMPNAVSWNGLWENGVELYGTVSLDLTFSGENMIYHGGSGSISGSLICTGWNGQNILTTTIDGIWENDLSSNHDLLEFTITTIDDRLTLGAYIHYETAGEITDDTFNMGSFSLDSHVGYWHTTNSPTDINSPSIASAVLIDHAGEFLDAEIINGSLYATLLEGSDYKVISINIADGSVSELPTTCDEPYGITYDGTNTWITGKEGSDPSLYKYSGIDFATDLAGYPTANSDLTNFDSISFLSSNLYYHNGSVLSSAIGSINTNTGSKTAILYDNFGSLPYLARTKHIAAVSGAFYTSYFAAGDEWCEIRKLNSATGILTSSWYSPVNGTGPIALNGSTLYLIQGTPARLYAMQL